MLRVAMTIYDCFDDTAQVMNVFAATAFAAVDGVNMGDPIARADELIAGDTYRLSPGATACPLSVRVRRGARDFRVSRGSVVGGPGARIHIDSTLTLMSSDGAVVSALVLVELGRADMVEATYLLPLDPLVTERDHALIRIERKGGFARYAESRCVAFHPSTRLTVEDERQIAAGDLRAGDRVLTRENGLQPLRWIGERTVRASDATAPVRIGAGTLGNARDLLVSPGHRVLAGGRARSGAFGEGRPVPAGQLVDGHAVTRTGGGFVHVVQLLFARNEIVHAEGVPVETLLDPGVALHRADTVERRIARIA